MSSKGLFNLKPVFVLCILIVFNVIALVAVPSGKRLNGLPIATFELKNNLTKQTVEDAVQQYKRDRAQRDSAGFPPHRSSLC